MVNQKFAALRGKLSTLVQGGRRPSRAIEVAHEDDQIAADLKERRFSLGTRPVIRWIKRDVVDDAVVRASIGQATRVFGRAVDYCLCTTGVGADRVRTVLEWATEPVEWWPLSSESNLALARRLEAAGCRPERYGYWWKWFPERVRPNGPEWVVDEGMIITGSPFWFPQWTSGADPCRVTQDDRPPLEGRYGAYGDLNDEGLRLYSGLISLPPKLRYMPEVQAILASTPLSLNHDERRGMCEQGVIAATFQRIGALAIPLCEFPSASAVDEKISYGRLGDQGTAWGFNFGRDWQQVNPHFDRLVQQGVVLSRVGESLSVVERFAWMGNFGQWGVPGWTMHDAFAALIVERSRAFVGQRILEIGTSRGRLTAMLASIGCRLTTIDRHDRGAAQNLEGLQVRVVIDDARNFLATTSERFDLIIVDLHGNSEADWKHYAPLLKRCLARPGTLIVDNAMLWKIPEWHEETGVRWFLENLSTDWTCELYPEPLPGVAIVSSV